MDFIVGNQELSDRLPLKRGLYCWRQSSYAVVVPPRYMEPATETHQVQLIRGWQQAGDTATTDAPPGNSSLNHRASDVIQWWGRTPGSDLYKPNCCEPYWNTLFATWQFLKFCVFFAVYINYCKYIFPAFYGTRRFITAFRSAYKEHIRCHTCYHSFLPTLHLTNRKDSHPANCKSIHAIDIPSNSTRSLTNVRKC